MAIQAANAFSLSLEWLELASNDTVDAYDLVADKLLGSLCANAPVRFS